MTDEQFADEGFIVSANSDEHIERVREVASIEGVDVVCCQLVGAADPMGSIRLYEETVLPALRS
ncbi:MAG: hypothetical protein ACR2NA_11075 [Solirubrobacterales bacterium]